MASDKSFVQFALDQLKSVSVTCKPMFGEYALYKDNKVVALICDSQLFVKQTEAGKIFAGSIPEAPAYPGAKPSLLATEGLEDSEWICELIRITAKNLPAARPRKKTGGKKKESRANVAAKKKRSK
jgi:TfoX/Sxy family transcriptional regulator of competence genes